MGNGPPGITAISRRHKSTAVAVVNIFETGNVQGDYAQVTCTLGDRGGLSYGRNQLTRASGNLYLLLRDYCADEEARFAAALAPFLSRLADADPALDHDRRLHSLLRRAGDDPAMIAAQDRLLDRLFWQPAERAAAALGLAAPLSLAIVYDGLIHGAFARIAREVGPGSGERDWVRAYIAARRAFLAAHANPLLRRTIYRMDAFERLIAEGNWQLDLPLWVRGVLITEDALDPRPPAREPAPRLLQLRAPPLRGPDVRRLQAALSALVGKIACDGIFGPETARAVHAFQQREGLAPDGIVGPATRAALELADLADLAAAS